MRASGERIKAARRRAGLTQADVGARLRVGKAAVSAWEKGVATPVPSRLWLLAMVLAPHFDLTAYLFDVAREEPVMAGAVSGADPQQSAASAAPVARPVPAARPRWRQFSAGLIVGLIAVLAVVSALQFKHLAGRLDEMQQQGQPCRQGSAQPPLPMIGEMAPHAARGRAQRPDTQLNPFTEQVLATVIDTPEVVQQSARHAEARR